LLGGGTAPEAKPAHRPKRRRRERDADADDTENRPGPSGRTHTNNATADRAGACPVCGVRLPPAELAAHVDAELAAALADDDEEEEEEEGGGGGRRPPPPPDDALLPPRPPPAVPAVFGPGGGGGNGGAGRTAKVTRPPPPSSSSSVRVPAWAATLAAVAGRPGRVDHYSDARAITMAGEALGIDGVAGAAAGWEVAGASGLGAAGLNGEQV
jgi:hypothetical protein